MTLFGNSAGGSSAHLHQISPQGAGLYGNVIAQSGSALTHIENMRKGAPQRDSARFATDLGCGYGHNQLQCLQVTFCTNSTHILF